IRDRDKVVEVVTAAKERGISIRIGVNAGSLPPDEMTGAGYGGREAVERSQEAVGQGTADGLEDLMELEAAPLRPPEETAERMVRAAMGHIRVLEDCDFGMGMIKVSLKASDVPTTLLANRKF